MEKKAIELIDWVYKNTKKASKEGYNIFNVLGVSEKEVIMCRFLADLINPEGKHGLGNVFLRSFISEVLSDERNKLNWGDDDFNHAHVVTEYLINDSLRRIDIVIYSNNRFLPIEAKINAEDQPSQCYEYWEYAKNWEYARSKNDKDACIWYLTKYGSDPSQGSRQNSNGSISMPDDKIHKISFNKDIQNWIDNIMNRLAGNNEAEEIKTVLKHYLDAIEDFAKGEDMGIVNKLYESAESYRAGKSIADSLGLVKDTLTNDILDGLEKSIEKDIPELHKGKNTEYMYYRNNVKYPGINYKIPFDFDDDELNNVSLYVRIEREDKLWAGVVALEQKENELVELVGGETITHMWDVIDDKYHVKGKDGFRDMDNNWNIYLLYDKFIDPSECSGNKVPKLNSMNEAAIELLDKDKREKFVQTVVQNIKQMLFDDTLKIFN